MRMVIDASDAGRATATTGCGTTTARTASSATTASSSTRLATGGGSVLWRKILDWFLVLFTRNRPPLLSSTCLVGWAEKWHRKRCSTFTVCDTSDSLRNVVVGIRKGRPQVFIMEFECGSFRDKLAYRQETSQEIFPGAWQYFQGGTSLNGEQLCIGTWRRDERKKNVEYKFACVGNAARLHVAQNQQSKNPKYSSNPNYKHRSSHRQNNVQRPIPVPRHCKAAHVCSQTDVRFVLAACRIRCNPSDTGLAPERKGTHQLARHSSRPVDQQARCLLQ